VQIALRRAERGTLGSGTAPRQITNKAVGCPGGLYSVEAGAAPLARLRPPRTSPWPREPPGGPQPPFLPRERAASRERPQRRVRPRDDHQQAASQSDSPRPGPARPRRRRPRAPQAGRKATMMTACRKERGFQAGVGAERAEEPNPAPLSFLKAPCASVRLAFPSGPAPLRPGSCSDPSSAGPRPSSCRSLARSLARRAADAGASSRPQLGASERASGASAPDAFFNPLPLAGSGACASRRATGFDCRENERGARSPSGRSGALGGAA
jgi:hypothetical protein